MLVMLSDKHTRNACSLSDQRSSQPRHPCEDSFVVKDDESIPKKEWTPGPQTGRGEQFRMISPVPSSTDLSTPPPRPPSDGHFTP
ncbi:hypothetical protein O181_101286 [Austropuccinia psidii MF-1]|uniref:Uncharacterized protein n=1 Tax=Austropuccinia psidii MF-1 TaxID=1389203 RepID=A0A9Q3JGV4_9BASI|nr:hypothetical protein [Austropuccinia psidii MF-1]